MIYILLSKCYVIISIHILHWNNEYSLLNIQFLLPKQLIFSIGTSYTTRIIHEKNKFKI